MPKLDSLSSSSRSLLALGAALFKPAVKPGASERVGTWLGPWSWRTIPPRTAPAQLSVAITSIPHARQRYDTCGDYVEGADGALAITVSELADWRETWLIAAHELVEAALVRQAGVSIAAIDAFDIGWQAPPGVDEPGNDPRAPYYRQHQAASGIERTLAAMIGVDWLAYEAHVAALSARTSA